MDHFDELSMAQELRAHSGDPYCATCGSLVRLGPRMHCPSRESRRGTATVRSSGPPRVSGSLVVDQHLRLKQGLGRSRLDGYTSS